MIKLFDAFWEFFERPVTEEDVSKPSKKDEGRRNTQWLKEFDTEWEIVFNEPGPFYDKQGKPKTEAGFGDIAPYIIRLVTEISRRSRS